MAFQRLRMLVREASKGLEQPAQHLQHVTDRLGQMRALSRLPFCLDFLNAFFMSWSAILRNRSMVDALSWDSRPFCEQRAHQDRTWR